jgi:DNA-binding CsgD family transcriptional regulator
LALPFLVARALLGAVFAASWLLALPFLGDVLGCGLPERLVAVAGLAGVACGLAALVLVARYASRGPEPHRLVAVVGACVPSLLLAGERWLFPSAPAPFGAAVWFLMGLAAAYAVRRALLLLESLVPELSAGGALCLTSSLVGAAAVVCLGLSRMDGGAACCAVALLVPAALALLPQGRLSLARRTGDSRAGLLFARRTPERLLRLAAATVAVCAFVGGVLADGARQNVDATLSYLLVLASAVAMGLVARRLPTNRWRSLLVGVLACAAAALGVQAAAPTDVTDLVGMVLAVAAYLVLLTALARGGFGDVCAPTKGFANQVAHAAAFAAVALGFGWAGPPGLALVLSALLLVCCAAILCKADDLSAAETPAPEPPAEEPAAPSAEPTPEPSVVPAAPAEEEPPAPPTLLERRCNAIAWRYGLSQREHDILILLAEGLSTQEVADRAFVSRNTVKSHMAHIYTKLGIHARSELDAVLDAILEDGE